MQKGKGEVRRHNVARMLANVERRRASRPMSDRDHGAVRAIALGVKFYTEKCSRIGFDALE